MAQFSCFAPFGLFTFGREPSPAEGIYTALVNAYKSLYDMTPGASYKEALVYATAIALASSRVTIQRMKNQRRPLKAVDKLPVLELDYGVVPGALDTIDQRQAAVHARELLMHGSREEAVTADLTALLGTGFLKYRVTQASELITWPTNPGATGAWQRPDAAPRFYQLLDSVDAILGVPTVRTARIVALNSSTAPIVGDVLCVEPEVNAVTEAVAITNIVTTWNLTATFTKTHAAGSTLIMIGTSGLITYTLTAAITSSMLNAPITVQVTGGAIAPATFTIDNDTSSAETITGTATAALWSITATWSAPHSIGAMVRTNMPIQTSTQREVQIIVTSAVARNAELRRQIGLIMQRHAKSVGRWLIIEASSSTQVGPWIFDDGSGNFARIGATAFGAAAQTF